MPDHYDANLTLVRALKRASYLSSLSPALSNSDAQAVFVAYADRHASFGLTGMCKGLLSHR